VHFILRYAVRVSFIRLHRAQVDNVAALYKLLPSGIIEINLSSEIELRVSSLTTQTYTLRYPFHL